MTTGFRCVLAPVGPQPAFTLPPLARPTEVPAPEADPEAPVERRLVAIWETKIAQPKGSTTIRWQQNADGRYTVDTNGTTTDAGTLTAADGRLRQTSDVTKLSMDVTYQFKSSTQLVTNGPLGTATWRRVRAPSTQPVEEKPSAPEEKKDPTPERRDDEPRPKTKTTLPPDVRREIQKRVPFRLPF